MKFSLLCSTYVFVCSMLFNSFHDPSINFLDTSKYRRVIEASTALSSGHDSYLCGSHLPLALVNVPPQRTTRVSLAGVNTAQEPGMLRVYVYLI